MFVANWNEPTGQKNFLYNNTNDGTFTKILTGEIVNDEHRSLGCSWGDYDNDGDLDLFVANDGGQNNSFYLNNGNNNNQAAHRGGIGFFFCQLVKGGMMKFRPVSDFLFHQPANNSRTNQKSYQQAGQRRRHRAENHILISVKAKPLIGTQIP